MPVRPNTPEESAVLVARRSERREREKRLATELEPVVADPTAAIAALLKDRMGSDVEGRVYRPELPREVDSTMPASAVVVGPGGGGNLMAANRLPVYDTIIDVLAYGANRLEADQIARRAQYELRQFAMVTYEDVLLYWAREASGIQPRQELEVNWPYSEASYQILHSELTLP